MYTYKYICTFLKKHTHILFHTYTRAYDYKIIIICGYVYLQPKVQFHLLIKQPHQTLSCPVQQNLLVLQCYISLLKM